MPDLTAQDMAAKLLADRFERTGPDARSLTDPIADTPMVVTLDQLRPYDLNPRVTRNPRYDDIKASMRERGLEAQPAITRRPGETHYIIRNGGNTRLSVLRELWAETRDEKFFRISCLFRPWSERGEIVALTGHLAENELRGALSFIERALGVEKARELYEQEIGKAISQTELARRLTADGYPVTQSHISRLQDAVQHLLPAIPSILYAGLGKPQIDRLTALRKAASRTWERHASRKQPTMEFSVLFQDVLAMFDGEPATFSAQRVQDELVGQMVDLLGADYDTLALEIVDAEAWQRTLTREPVVQPSLGSSQIDGGRAPPALRDAEPASPKKQSEPQSSPPRKADTPPREDASTPGAGIDGLHEKGELDGPANPRLQGHVVSPVETTDRLQAIQRSIAEATGESLQDFTATVVHAIPVQAGGLHPISDVWYIEPALDAPDRLRAHIAQLAREIAQEADLASCIESVADGIGFACHSNGVRSAGSPPPFFARAVLSLLNALSAAYIKTLRSSIDGVRLVDDLAPLLQGVVPTGGAPQCATRLSDEGLVKLFRLLRLARRLVELESSSERQTDEIAGR